MRHISIAQTIIAVVALTCATAAGMTGHLSEGAMTALYTAVIAGALGYVNGKKSADKENGE